MRLTAQAHRSLSTIRSSWTSDRGAAHGVEGLHEKNNFYPPSHRLEARSVMNTQTESRKDRRALNPFGDSGQALVDVNLAALAEQELSLFFDPHMAHFILADFKFMRLEERFGKPAGMLLD